jgi:hypothetical protein
MAEECVIRFPAWAQDVGAIGFHDPLWDAGVFERPACGDDWDEDDEIDDDDEEEDEEEDEDDEYFADDDEDDYDEDEEDEDLGE